MSLKEHAKIELDRAQLFDSDSDYNGDIGKSVMELIEVFSNQGHSGYSASIVRNIFNQLSDYKPLGGISGEEDEWVEVSKGIFQNKRLSSVFKDITIQNCKPYYLSAICWKDDESTFTGSVKTKDGKVVSSRQFIKSFPFYEKTFYIEVKDINDDYIITNEGMKELEEVFKYYDKYEIH